MIDDTDDDDKSNTGLSIGTIATIIAVIALTLAWIAYNRTGKGLEDNVSSDTYNSAAENFGENTRQDVDSVDNSIDSGLNGVDEARQ